MELAGALSGSDVGRLFLVAVGGLSVSHAAVAALVLGTSPRSRLRPVAVASLGALSWLWFEAISAWVDNKTMGAIASAMAIANFFMAVDLLLATRLDRADAVALVRQWRRRRLQGPHLATPTGERKEEGKKGPAETDVATAVADAEVPPTSQFLAVFLLPMNGRGSGTKWEVKGIPGPYSYAGKGASRARFLGRAALRTLLIYVVLELMDQFPPPGPELVAPTRLPLFSRLGDVTAWELAFRLGVTGALTLRAAFVLSFYQGLVELLGVATGLARPEDCRPVFGSPLDLWSIRNAWG